MAPFGEPSGFLARGLRGFFSAPPLAAGAFALLAFFAAGAFFGAVAAFFVVALVATVFDLTMSHNSNFFVCARRSFCGRENFFLYFFHTRV
jgi:hypothetical protein